MSRPTREERTLKAMIALYCRDTHRPDTGLCEACTALQAYALNRLARCRYGAAKPACSACPIHCYTPAMREAIRAVMRHAGPRMLARHPVLAVGHLLDRARRPPPQPARVP